MTEAEIQSAIWLAVGSRPDVRLWRNNVGIATFSGGQRVKYGLANPGGSDLIGFRKIVVPPEAVGQTLAVFTAIEIKTTVGRVSDEQKAFIRAVQQFGGFAGVARSVDEANAIVGRLK